MTCLFICLPNEWKKENRAKTGGECGRERCEIKFKIRQREDKFKSFAYCLAFGISQPIKKEMNRQSFFFMSCLSVAINAVHSLPSGIALSTFAFDQNQSHREAVMRLLWLSFALNGGSTFLHEANAVDVWGHRLGLRVERSNRLIKIALSRLKIALFSCKVSINIQHSSFIIACPLRWI